DQTFVAAVGAYLPEMAELPPGLVRRSRVFVDTLEGAQAEAGDLIMAGIDWSGVTPLEEALDAPRAGKGPVVFKSVGHGGRGRSGSQKTVLMVGMPMMSFT